MIFIDDVTTPYPMYVSTLISSLSFSFLDQPYIPYQLPPTRNAFRCADDSGDYVETHLTKYTPDPIEPFPWFPAGNYFA